MISKRIKNLKIATVLPYKENYSFRKSFCSIIYGYQNFLKTQNLIKIITYMDQLNSKDYLTRNYINIDLKSFRITISEYNKRI